MAPMITLVVPSRLQHRARRSLARPTAYGRGRGRLPPVVCILTALAGRLQHQRVREQGGGHRRQARLWETSRVIWRATRSLVAGLGEPGTPLALSLY